MRLLLIPFLIFSFYFKSLAQELVKLSDLQKKEFVDVHNQWRADVGTNPLKWNDAIAEYAAEWALRLGRQCKMEHRPPDGKWKRIYGENIYWISTSEASPKHAVDSWGSEIQYYKKPVPIKANTAYGHYTQMVWKNTTEVGCAIAECGKGGTIVVCNYNPPGNWLGETAYDK
jgi:pathogenesis-related protein 1